jgi:hypothetical protein
MKTERGSPTIKRPEKEAAGRFHFGWKFRLVAVGIALILTFLDTQWKMIDRYFPRLNEVLHAGSVSSKGDVGYLMGHLRQDMQTLSDPCTDDMIFRECRARMISNKPTVEDFNLRVVKLDEAWIHEIRELSVPQVCQDEMDQILRAYKDYASTENDMLGLLESMDSEEATKRLMPNYNGASGKDNAAWSAVRRLRKSAACLEY